VLDQSIGTEIIRDIVAEFSVTVIVVLGHERLYNDMVRRYSDKSGVAVVKLARSGGAVELSDAYVQKLQNYRTKQYFYGELKNVLSPVSRTLDFKNIKVYRLAEGVSSWFCQLMNQGTLRHMLQHYQLGRKHLLSRPRLNSSSLNLQQFCNIRYYPLRVLE